MRTCPVAVYRLMVPKKKVMTAMDKIKVGGQWLSVEEKEKDVDGFDIVI